MRVRFVGSGDAFGSGGRWQTCIHVSGAGQVLLVDCGATSLTALKAQGLNPNEVGALAVTGRPCSLDRLAPAIGLQPITVSGRRNGMWHSWLAAYTADFSNTNHPVTNLTAVRRESWQGEFDVDSMPVRTETDKADYSSTLNISR